LSAVRENIDKIQSELFQVVVNHHQVAVLPLQFLFIGLDLHLPWHWLLLVHLISPPDCSFELTTSPFASLGSIRPDLSYLCAQENNESSIDILPY
jgi:hypothetical protein